MGYKLREELIGRTRATHLRLLVYLALADRANDDDYKLFGTIEAWPSQGRLAWELNSSRRSIGRALAELEGAGEIRKTCRTKGRGCVVYELTPPEPKPDYDPAAEYAEPTPKSATLAHLGEGASSPTPILAPPTPILVTPPTPIPATEPTPKSATEPEGEPEVEKPEVEHTPAGAGSASHPELNEWRVKKKSLAERCERDPGNEKLRAFFEQAKTTVDALENGMDILDEVAA